MPTTLLLLLCAVPLAAAEDARAIVERSIQNFDRGERLARQYTYTARGVVRDLDGNGRVVKTRTETNEVLFIGSKRYEHPIERDGKPLPPADARKAQEKLDKAVREASRITAAERQKRERELDREREEVLGRMRLIPIAYNLKLLGEDLVSGRPAFRIAADPKPEYRGKYDNLFRNMRGVLWIDKQDYRLSRIDAESLDTISFGLFLARLGKGAKIVFEQTRVNDEVWLPKRIAVDASARLALVKKFNLSAETTYGNYRKFQSESRVTAITERLSQ